MKCCPTCHQPLPPDLPEGVSLSRSKRVIFETVKKKRGCSTADIIFALYGNRINGGPDNAMGVVHTMICQLNYTLRAGRPRLRIENIPGTGYVIREIDERHLTLDDVVAIRAKYKPRFYDQRRLAIEYGVSQPTISDVIRRKIWSHV